MDCEEGICGDCMVIGSHKKHNVGTLKEGFRKTAASFKKQMDSYLNLTKEFKGHKKGFAEHLTDKVKKLERLKIQVSEDFEELRNLLEKKEGEIIAIISSVIAETVGFHEITKNIEPKVKELVNDCSNLIK